MIVVLSGGVGGARLCAGLVKMFLPEELLVVVNTGDDFDHWGLRICPDLDTVMYTLGGRVNEEMGWGIAGDTWSTLEGVKRAGGDDWFRLGDQDLVTHLARTAQLGHGRPLSAVTAALFRAAGVEHGVTPVTDGDHRSLLTTDEGVLAFQEYFVRRQCRPRLQGIEFSSGKNAPAPAPLLAEAMVRKDVRGVIVCPSNPVLSVAPILAVAGVREWLQNRSFPVLAVSPFVGGKTIKGPAAKIFQELALETSVTGLAAWYRGLVDGWLVAPGDEPHRLAGSRFRAGNIMLDSAERRVSVAAELKDWLALH